MSPFGRPMRGVGRTELPVRDLVTVVVVVSSGVRCCTVRAGVVAGVGRRAGMTDGMLGGRCLVEVFGSTVVAERVVADSRAGTGFGPVPSTRSIGVPVGVVVGRPCGRAGILVGAGVAAGVCGRGDGRDGSGAGRADTTGTGRVTS